MMKSKLVAEPGKRKLDVQIANPFPPQHGLSEWALIPTFVFPRQVFFPMNIYLHMVGGGE